MGKVVKITPDVVLVKPTKPVVKKVAGWLSRVVVEKQRLREAVRRREHLKKV
jgi:hypothetical protein